MDQYQGGYGSDEEDPDLIPITLLSGFLGAGKTTLLKHILQNNDGLKVGVLVNDVADVNIDAKLIRSQEKGGDGVGADMVAPSDIVELSNGCVCCSVSSEMLKAVDWLIQRNGDKPPYDNIVIECSGVAEPAKVRENFQDAELEGAMEMDEVRLYTMATVVDASKFMAEWESRTVMQVPQMPTHALTAPPTQFTRCRRCYCSAAAAARVAQEYSFLGQPLRLQRLPSNKVNNPGAAGPARPRLRPGRRS